MKEDGRTVKGDWYERPTDELASKPEGGIPEVQELTPGEVDVGMRFFRAEIGILEGDCRKKRVLGFEGAT